MTLDDDVAAVRNDADILAQGILGLIGLGVLQAAHDDNDAINFLGEAYRHLATTPPTAESLAAARIAIIKGEGALELLVTQRGRRWRAWHVHQTGLFLYHIGWLLILLALGTSCVTRSRWCVVPDTILEGLVPVVALVAGGLGAELRGLWFLWKQTSRRLYRRRFLLGHLVAPFTGALLGLITYLLAKGGLLALGATSPTQAQVRVGELALCFFAGFKWEWAIQRMQQIFETSQKGPTEKKPEEKKPEEKKP